MIAPVLDSSSTVMGITIRFARPFVTAVYGSGEEGIEVYVAKLKAELCDVMAMCGAKNISEINSDMLF